MSGRLVGIIIVTLAALAGAAIYYLQVYGYYEPVELQQDGVELRLTSLVSGAPEPILADDFEGIDADSSPIRYRACFATDLTPDALAQVFALADKVEPRNAPGWFDCFDAEAIGSALDSGQARAFLSQKNIEYGVDRVVAITSDGRGYVWHEINDCGDKAFDGSPLGSDCPPRDED